MMEKGRVERVVVVAPTTHICRQWALDAARYGIEIEPNRANAEGIAPSDSHGISVTYQTIAADPKLHRRGVSSAPTLLIADEPHHMGEAAAWGESMVSAFSDATFRLLLSGTPFRSDNTAIPWVTYDEDGISQADYVYGYTEGLLDRVCRPVSFHTFDGDMEWMSDGQRKRADFSVVLPRVECARRLRTALDPDGEWVDSVLKEGDRRLSQIRAGDHRDAAGLVVAIDKEHAERLAERLGRITGKDPSIVTSDADDASQRIARFAAGSGEWLVSVLMVSEGVDIPRLRVGVYATTARTELFFRQVVGRFVRRTPQPKEQMSHLFMPADLRLKRLAEFVEEERNHALVAAAKGEVVEREPALKKEPENNFRAIWSNARREEEVLRTTQPGEPLTLFDDPAPSPFLAAFQPAGAGAMAVASTAGAGAGPAIGEPNAEDRYDRLSAIANEPAHVRRARLRAERKALVADIARNNGDSHSAINARINRELGIKSVTSATIEQLEAGIKLLRKMAR
jgi:superfamily II DNA or RNA helicase